MSKQKLEQIKMSKKFKSTSTLLWCFIFLRDSLGPSVKDTREAADPWM